MNKKSFGIGIFLLFFLIMFVFISAPAHAADSYHDLTKKAMAKLNTVSNRLWNRTKPATLTSSEQKQEQTDTDAGSVGLNLNDRLKAFFSIGLPAIRGINLEPEDKNYRALLGINLSL